MKILIAIAAAFLLLMSPSALACSPECNPVCMKYVWGHCVDWGCECPGPEGEQGPQGEQGETGDTGEVGPQGDPGNAQQTVYDYIAKAITCKTEPENMSWIQQLTCHKYEPIIDLLDRFFVSHKELEELDSRVRSLERKMAYLLN